MQYPKKTMHLTRRDILRTSALGFGSLALADLLQATPHRPAKARGVIMLVQNGGPSPMDLFDPKPDLKRREGQVYAERVEMFQKGSEANKLLGTPFKFHHRGPEVSTRGTPVLNLRPSAPVPDDARRDQLGLLAKLNEEHRRQFPNESELEARIRNYELAARMQLAAGELLDLSRESAAMKR